METKKEVSTQTAAEEATVGCEQIKAGILGMARKEVSTQTAQEISAGSTQATKAQISASPMKKVGRHHENVGEDDRTEAVTAAEDNSDEPAKSLTAKKKASLTKTDGSLPESVGDNSMEAVTAAEGHSDEKAKNPTAKKKKDSFKRRKPTAETLAVEPAEYEKDDEQTKTNFQLNNAEGSGEAEPGEEDGKQNVGTSSIQSHIDSNVRETERHESSTSSDETDSCSSLSSAAFHIESGLEDSSPQMHIAMAEAAVRLPVTHAPDCKRRKFLAPDETQAVIQLQDELGKFSFYICGDGRVVIHPEDTMAQKNRELLKYRFLDIVGVKLRGSQIDSKDSSFKGIFCTHRIGAKVVADGRQTTAGMYVSHNGVLYLISSAHNYVFSESGYDGSEKKELLLLDEGRSFIDVAGEKVPLRPLYCLFSRTCDLKEKGRRIMHLVDISIGLAPVCTSHMERGRAQFCASIEEGQDYCRDCDETVDDCNDSRHRKDSNPCQFKIARFYDFGGPMCCPAENGEDQLRRYYDEKLVNEGGALLRCRPCDRSVVAGKVLSFDNAVTLRIDEQRTMTVTNVLLIKPEKRSVTPRLGDSGSVWVLDGTNDAVAITVGLGEAPDGGLLWAAAPLQPLLEALCCAFDKVFPDVSTIKPACHGIARPCTTPGSEAAAMATPLSEPSITASLVGLVTEDDSAYASAPSNPES